MVYCILLTIFSSFILVNVETVEAWWDSDWDRHKVLTISNPNAGYQMMITVYQDDGHDSTGTMYSATVDTEGNCQDDFGDIRFLDNDDTTPLDYWLQEYTSGDNAIFWVETSGDATIHMYYDTSGASSTTSNGFGTFLWFDDFEDGDVSGWLWGDESDGTFTADNSYSAHGSYSAKYDQGTSSNCGFYQAYDCDGLTFGAWVMGDDVSAQYNYYAIQSSTDYASNCIIGRIYQSDLWYKNSGGSWVAQCTNCLSDYEFKWTEFQDIDDSTDTFDFWIDGAEITSSATYRFSADADYIYVGGTKSVPGYNIWVDSMYIREHEDTEPAWSVFGSEQTEEGNQAPINNMATETPTEGDTGISLNPSVGITINDPEGDLMNQTFRTNASDTWLDLCYNNDTYNASLSNTTADYGDVFSQYNTKYWISSNVTDGNGGWDNDTWYFTTVDYTPDAPASFTATTISTSQIDLSWTDDTEADTTRVEWYPTEPVPWDVGSGNLLYNNTGETTSHSSLDSGEDYFYKSWSWNDTQGIYSAGSTDDATTRSIRWNRTTFGGSATVEEASIDVRTDPTTWTGGSVNCGDNIQNNFTFYQDGTATIEIKIGVNATNYTFVNYTTWSANGGDQYCANFTINEWSSESMIEPKVGENPVTILKDSLSGDSNFLFGVRIWMPKGLTSTAVLEDFEIMLVATDIS